MNKIFTLLLGAASGSAVGSLVDQVCAHLVWRASESVNLVSSLIAIILGGLLGLLFALRLSAFAFE